MAFIERIKQRAKENIKTIVLPEGNEERNVIAAGLVKEAGIAEIILVGNPEVAQQIAKDNNVDISGITIIDPISSDKLDSYTETFYEMRKAKGITMEQARQTMLDPVYYGTMMVKMGDADGMVSGAIHSTGDTIRPALQIIKSAPGVSVVSSCFIMETPNTKYGEDGVFIFSDCGLIPNPTSEELASIAISAEVSARQLTEFAEPRLAMLSFSTKGSAKHPDVEKVQIAAKLAKEKAPYLLLDGELQGDAALVESVGQLKSPGSPVAGKANVLIFPDLDAGNIAYKLVQRLTDGEAYGPIIQGLAKPVNDLSRGCCPEDIVCVVAITAVQAMN